MSVSPAVMRRLMRELAQLQNSPPEGIRVVTSEDNMLDVTGIIEGPEGTPYAGGYFKVRFKFTEEFPAAPPKCWFATKIFHPNVSSAGEICVNTLKKDWQSSYGIGHILVTVKCLLIYPNPESALDEEAGKLLLEDYNSYCDRAKLITSVHATPKTRPPEFNTLPSSSSSTPAKSTTATAPKHKSTTDPMAPFLAPAMLKTVPVTSPASSSTPFQSSASNTLSFSESASSISSDKSSSTCHTSPLGNGDSTSNVAANAAANVHVAAAAPARKAVKRGAAPGGGLEKRKKALKRL